MECWFSYQIEKNLAFLFIYISVALEWCLPRPILSVRVYSAANVIVVAHCSYLQNFYFFPLALQVTKYTCTCVHSICNLLYDCFFVDEWFLSVFPDLDTALRVRAYRRMEVEDYQNTWRKRRKVTRGMLIWRGFLLHPAVGAIVRGRDQSQRERERTREKVWGTTRDEGRMSTLNLDLLKESENENILTRISFPRRLRNQEQPITFHLWKTPRDNL